MIQDHALSSLVNNKDVVKPISSRLHALTFQQIMRENNNDVDALGPAFDPLAGRFVGPDGLSDAGDPADIALLNSLSGDNQMDADDMNAIDAKYGVGTSFKPEGFYQRAVSDRHDMSQASASIDARSSRNLDNIRRKKGSFKRDVTPLSNIIPQPAASKFHALADTPVAESGRSEGVSMTSRFSLVHHDGQMRIGQVCRPIATIERSHKSRTTNHPRALDRRSRVAHLPFPLSSDHNPVHQ